MDAKSGLGKSTGSLGEHYTTQMLCTTLITTATAQKLTLSVCWCWQRARQRARQSHNSQVEDFLLVVVVVLLLLLSPDGLLARGGRLKEWTAGPWVLEICY